MPFSSTNTTGVKRRSHLHRNIVGSRTSIDKVMTDLSLAIADLNFKTPHNLLTLPQEIQDIIFDYTYPRQEDFKILVYVTPEQRKDHTRKHKVSEFMVSKAFFIAAAKTFVGNQIFDDEMLALPWGNVVHPFVVEAKLPFYRLRRVEGLVNLRTVTAIVSSTEYKFHVRYAKFKQRYLMKACRPAMHLRGLRDLRLEYLPSPWLLRPTTSAMQVRYKSNVQQAEDFLRPLVTSPPDESTFGRRNAVYGRMLGTYTRLYAWSEVTFEPAVTQPDFMGRVARYQAEQARRDAIWSNLSRRTDNHEENSQAGEVGQDAKSNGAEMATSEQDELLMKHDAKSKICSDDKHAPLAAQVKSGSSPSEMPEQRTITTSLTALLSCGWKKISPW